MRRSSIVILAAAVLFKEIAPVGDWSHGIVAAVAIALGLVGLVTWIINLMKAA